MILPDVNVLVYAHRRDWSEHVAYREWLEATAAGPEPVAISELVLSGVVRVVTNRRIWVEPSSVDEALGFARSMRSAPTAVIVRPGPRHWDIFEDLVTRTNTTGPRVSDAYLAALAIETGSEFITTDRDFARFPGLRWRHPLQAA